MTASRRGVLMGVLVAGLAGCTSTQSDTSPSPTSAAPTPTPSAVPSPSPSSSPTPVPRATLTGMTVTDPATLTRPAVAVKVPNLKVEQPQVGLNAADIVICQPNGDSATRLCPIFHSQYPDAAGAVRSIRPADVPLLSPIFPLFANTGAADWVMNYVKANSEHLERMTYLDYRGTAAYSVDKLAPLQGERQDPVRQGDPGAPGRDGLAHREGQRSRRLPDLRARRDHVVRRWPARPRPACRSPTARGISTTCPTPSMRPRSATRAASRGVNTSSPTGPRRRGQRPDRQGLSGTTTRSGRGASSLTR